MTRSATRWATTCWCRPPAGSATPCGPATPRPGWAGTSSPPSSAARTPRPTPPAAPAAPPPTRPPPAVSATSRTGCAPPCPSPTGWTAYEVRVGASIGIAFAESGTTPGDIMRNADLAMYRAKQAGKGRVELYAPRLQSDAVRRTELAGRVQEGPGRRRVHPAAPARGRAGRRPDHRRRGPRPLAFQPAAACSPRPSSCAAPTTASGGQRSGGGCWSRRWSRPRSGTARATVSPSPCGSPPAACSTATRPPPASSTCSPGTSCRPADWWSSCPARDPEIALEELERRLNGLRRLGVRIALGGFTGGFGALGALRTLPVDVIKLDRAFTEGVVESARQHKITSGLLRDRRRPRHPGRGRRRRPARAGPTLRDMGCPHGLGLAFAGPLEESPLRGSLTRGGYPVPGQSPREQVTSRVLPLPSRRSNAETTVPPA